MNSKRYINLRHVSLDKNGLENHIKNVALGFEYRKNSDKNTFIIKSLKDDYKFIYSVYKLLNNHIKLGIKIHSAGEWLLDNFYIIEENVKYIEKELTLKKYKKLIGIKEGKYKGIPRIEVLAEEITTCTNLRIDFDNLEIIMKAYSEVDSLSLSEIECFEYFLKISLIKKIRNICEKIYISQIQKYKVEKIISKTIDEFQNEDGQNKKKYLSFRKNIKDNRFEKNFEKTTRKFIEYRRNSFIEYLSYKLKTYGKLTGKYQEILENEIQKIGESVSEIIRKEHINVAMLKVIIGNGIMSLKRLSHISFIEMYGNLNIAEKNLKKDISNVYPKMDVKTKELYRRELEKIAKKYKISEKYITEKILELSSREGLDNIKKSHVGYYIVDEGKIELLENLGINVRRYKYWNKVRKEKLYISFNLIFSMMLSFVLSTFYFYQNIFLNIFFTIILYVPISEIILRILNYILSKYTKPKIVPKLDYEEKIPNTSKTFVVIPTIIKNVKKIDDIIKKLEIYYLANKMDNLYFAILGDVSEEDVKELKEDSEIVNYGLKKINELNEKYKNNNLSESNSFSKFHFLYRERIWNTGEGKYIGWERKRGLLYTFNLYIKNKIKDNFKINTIENEKENLPDIKYVITLDSDTSLNLDTAKQMIGAMDHVLNVPILKENNVISGYAIMQPNVGVDLENYNKSLFTRLYSKQGGIDLYSQMGFDVYQDCFNEGIFTGKGIYNVDVFLKVLENEIPENTVLSHDLLEGIFLRTLNLSDVVLLDGVPSKYLAYISRNHRWVRGDIQIYKWLFSKRLNRISKFKILDNIRRTCVKPTNLFILLILFIFSFLNWKNYSFILNFYPILFLIFFTSLSIMYLLEIFNNIIYKESIKQGNLYAYKKFSGELSYTKSTFLRWFLDFIFLPYEAYKELDAIIRSLYRMKKKVKLLEWTTSEDTEKHVFSYRSYYKEMICSVILGVLFLFGNIVFKIYGILLIISPMIAYLISTEYKEKDKKVNENDKKYLQNIAEKTWNFFKDNINKENNYLITDNYQVDRKNKIVERTSSTNIGLELIVVISAYDMKLLSIKESISYLKNILFTIQRLEKWNGHLYNWYNTKTLKPLLPKYISTVDSGNFIGYLYIVKKFLEENKNKDDVNILLDIVNSLIDNTNFKELYNDKTRLFSIGFNIEQNKLTDSYYDLLASEARQASLVAIAKRDVKPKHWNNLSRSLTNFKEYKGLVSWSGTAFEYLMPNINFRRYKGSLLDESSIFLVESQIEYAKLLNVPWGISESAYNLKDLNNNYQYKAFGIPWLGLKRGLEDEIVISPYSTFLSLEYKAKEGIENLKKIENLGGTGKYGFYEAIDFTLNRIPIGKKYSVIKCFMAHHQGLIFLSINNFLNSNILRKRFNDIPEIAAVNILLQENMPKNVVITKENKEKTQKKKVKIDSGYIEIPVDNNYLEYNHISNLNYSVLINNLGESKSIYNGKCINNFKDTSYLWQGIKILFKDLNTKKIIDGYENSHVVYYPDKVVFKKEDGALSFETSIFLDPNRNVEIRNIVIENTGNKDELIETVSFFDPMLTEENEFFAHPVFNKLFMKVYTLNDNNENIFVEKNNRELNEKVVLGVSLYTEENIVESGFEIDKQMFMGRKVTKVPDMILNNIQFSNNIKTLKDYIVALKKVIKVPMKEKVSLSLILSVSQSEKETEVNLEEVKSNEEINKINELSKARAEEECKYLGVKNSDLEIYRKFISYLYLNKIKENKYIYEMDYVWKYGISGDNKIIMCEIKGPENIYELERIINLYEYLRAKNIYVDLIIIDDEKNVYEKFVKELIDNIILNKHLEYLKYVSTGIFILNKNEIDVKEYECMKYLSIVYIDLENVGIETFIRDNKVFKRLDKNYLFKNDNLKSINLDTGISSENSDESKIQNIVKNLDFYNEYGGFLNNGKEYVWIKKVGKNFPNPMVNIIGNNKFGQIITDNLGGMLWYKNSRLNRITSWENDICFDLPSEVYYLYEKEKDYVWSLNYNLLENKKDVLVKYGFGFAKYEYIENNFDIDLEVIIPSDKTYKIMKFKIENKENKERNLSFASFVKFVLGENELKDINKINIYEKNNVLYAENVFKGDFVNKSFVYVDSQIINFTNSIIEFFGEDKNTQKPKILYKNVDMKQNGIKGAGYKVNLNFKNEEVKEFTIVIGVLENDDNLENIKKDVKEKYEEFKYKEINKWNDIISTLKIKTPSKKIDYLVNGWLLYQTYQSRLYSKSGYYQSGGAEGFRDQLQDAIGIKFYDSTILREQIVKCARHQFIEGDVLHWWHNHNKKGVRTMFSDDLLWLVYATYEYIEFENSVDILFEEIEYLGGNKLEDLGVLEKYDTYYNIKFKEMLFLHLKRAIDLCIKRGLNPFPKIWIGDWNDGFSNLGNEGKGESVWLGFFLYDNLEKFIRLYEDERVKERLKEKGLNNVLEKDVKKYKEIKEDLKRNLNTVGWDGRWYKRAINDDGIEIGSINSKECKIDGLVQAWSVISEAGDNDKKYIAMSEAENYLVDKENGIIKLFTPSFENVEFNPGYIKAYPEGIRENGGQYTHAAIWFCLAYLKLGFFDKAFEYLEMINPISHTESYEKMNKFKLESYVMCADIYSNKDLLGVGGWNWYTGSSSWYLNVVIEHLLGLKIKNGFLEINPKIPSYWQEFELEYKYKSCKYNVKVRNVFLTKEEEKGLYVNGIKEDKCKIKLEDNGKIYNLEFLM